MCGACTTCGLQSNVSNKYYLATRQGRLKSLRRVWTGVGSGAVRSGTGLPARLDIPSPTTNLPNLLVWTHRFETVHPHPTGNKTQKVMNWGMVGGVGLRQGKVISMTVATACHPTGLVACRLSCSCLKHLCVVCGVRPCGEAPWRELCTIHDTSGCQFITCMRVCRSAHYLNWMLRGQHELHACSFAEHLLHPCNLTAAIRCVRPDAIRGDNLKPLKDG